MNTIMEEQEEFEKYLSPTTDLNTGENVNGTWWARQTIDKFTYLGEGDTESEAIDDLMIACGKFENDKNDSVDSGLWG